MYLRRYRFRILARIVAFLDRIRRRQRCDRARRPRLEIGPLESREPPSNAISALHPIVLLADIGVDPLTNVPVADVPVTPGSRSEPPPNVIDHRPRSEYLASPPRPGYLTGGQLTPAAAEPPRQGTDPVDWSIDTSQFHLPPLRLAGSEGTENGSGGNSGNSNLAEASGFESGAMGGSDPDYGSSEQGTPAENQAPNSDHNSTEPATDDVGESTSASPATVSESFAHVASGSDNASSDVSSGSGSPSRLPANRRNAPPTSASPTTPTIGAAPSVGSLPVSLTPSGTPANSGLSNGYTLPAELVDPRSPSVDGTPNSSPPSTGFHQNSNGSLQPILPDGIPGGVNLPGADAPVTPADGIEGAPLGTMPSANLVRASDELDPSLPGDGSGGGGGGPEFAPAPPGFGPGLTRSGHYTITITQTASNTTDGFTLVETAAVDYDLSVNPSSQYAWDATVEFAYDFTRGTDTLSGTNSFTSHIEGEGTQIIVDGGVWGGVADANDANPFSFGFYNYNLGHFSVTGVWTNYHWDEHGYGYHNAIYSGTEASSTITGSNETNAVFSVWASAYVSNSFTYSQDGSNTLGQIGISTYSLHATGSDLFTSSANGSVVTAPTVGATGDSVSASYDYHSSSNGDYTVSQWGSSATANYTVEDHRSISSSLHAEATATFHSVMEPTSVAGNAAYVANDSAQGTFTAVGSGSYAFGSRTGNDTVSASVSALATADSSLTVNYAGGGTGNYRAFDNAGYTYTATVRASDSYTAIGSGSSLTASVTAESAMYTASDTGTYASDLSATFASDTTGTESSVWGLSLTNAYAFSDGVTGREVGAEKSAAHTFSEDGDYSYSLSVTSTATSTGAGTSGGTDNSTVTRSAFFQTSSTYSLSGTGNDSQWVSGTNTLSSYDATATIDGTGNDNDRLVANGRFVHTNTTATIDDSSATFNYSATNADAYSYHADATAVQTPTS